MSSNRARMMITDDLSIQILQRLPIKSIFRFRCVCKSWNSVISSPFFINLYHSFSATAPPHQKPYLLFEFSNTHLTIYNPIHPPHLTYLMYPIKPLNFTSSPNFTLIDMIHGVVCVSYSSFYSSFYSTILWNPSIQKYTALPQSVTAPDKNNIGFGFDSSNHDFKVIRVWNKGKPPIQLCCEVYSSREGVCRKKKGSDNIVECELYEFRTNSGCFYNGFVHWFVSASRGKYSVLMFDFAEEVFSRIDMPDEANKVMNSGMPFIKIAEYSGKLVVVMYSRAERSVKMWMMMEQSWIELSTVFEGVPNPFCRNGVPMLIEDGDFIKLNIWDPEEAFGTVLNKNGISHQPLKGGLFEESMFLMDGTNSKSCTD